MTVSPISIIADHVLRLLPWLLRFRWRGSCSRLVFRSIITHQYARLAVAGCSSKMVANLPLCEFKVHLAPPLGLNSFVFLEGPSNYAGSDREVLIVAVAN